MKGRPARSCMPPAKGALRSARLPGDGPPPRHPTKSVLPDDAHWHFGSLDHFAGLDGPMSAAATRERIGWESHRPSVLDDLEQGHYDRPDAALHLGARRRASRQHNTTCKREDDSMSTNCTAPIVPVRHIDVR